ncbi:E3 ubiquitin-protein ligase [Vigna unguiculata]|uniref:RING-type E3 ubiquitin transferase n=1 Tax=Vigna unguiculata TaxID=3917 RepID=A0A4D6M2T4_VIGUN|nr:E3 ubiquitin-protein ligase [Vigna unguiculata]
MDECHCRAYPQVSASDRVSESPFFHNDQQHFNVQFEYSEMYVFSARKFDAFCKVSLHNFPNIPKNQIMQETTIVSWLSHMGVPRNSHSVVVAEVLRCVRDMVRDTDTHVLGMHVEMNITRATEDEISDSDSDNDDSFEEVDDDGFEEDDDEDDYGLVAADKAIVEDLEMVEEKGSERCSICFEDFDVGVRMPCLHMFHKNCISEWLQRGNSCPLCRFQLPTQRD